MFINYIKKKILSKKLKKINHKKIPKFSFNGLKCYCRVVNVYDGDTITLLFERNKEIIKTSCRLYGIDCAELRTKNPIEKQKAIESKNFLKDLIYEKIIFVVFGSNCKYGRPLITIFKKGININDLLVEKGLAVKYYGGKKNINKLLK